MTLDEAMRLITPGMHKSAGTWADLGAGTGMFTQALMEILEEGKIIAVDKNPHVLHQFKIVNPTSKINVEVLEGDYHNMLQLPPLDGIIMANALHYARDPVTVVKNIISSLKQDGVFILIEYEMEIPNPPWVPYPVTAKKFAEICVQTDLVKPTITGWHNSVYNGRMYAAKTFKNNLMVS